MKYLEFFAVLPNQRLLRPTIFSSCYRGDVHPRVTGCKSEDKCFSSLAEARAWLRERSQEEIDEVLKDRHPYRGKGGFYAVANGRKTSEVVGACFKKFETEKEAEAFIEDWKQAVVQVYMVEIKTALDNGFRPAHMKFNVKKKLLQRDTRKAEEPEPVKAEEEEETLEGGASLSLEALGLEDEEKVPIS
ncbi:hypothetical protein BBO_06724 [Beauveria brongniartii RCEF 3172]|uniref:Uncharacterized protein n=1 Tax=Beauveria brongniartii RCEF 3172 TaxID=1081107 RepID=A0A167AT82_9HYPO|nr:hypothetical protein BBO_06724 [Beauveria brongniartii RCEF 3172]